MSRLFKTVWTGVVVSTLTFAGLLWFSREEWLPSQSAFAGTKYQIWYILMHTSIFFSFLLSGIYFRKFYYYIVSLGVLGILAFDMHVYPMLHNISTAFTLFVAVLSLIFDSPKRERPYQIFLGCFAAGIFGVGLWEDTFHLFLAEVFAELGIGVMLLRRIWDKN